jgi:hypothetical protein
MRLQSLIHLVESARALARSRRVIVLGSAAFLASFPEIGESGQPLEPTLDADFLLEPMSADLADLLKDAIGEPSILFQKHGYYADCLRPEIVETFPAGWEGRLVTARRRSLSRTCSARGGIYRSSNPDGISCRGRLRHRAVAMGYL